MIYTMAPSILQREPKAPDSIDICPTDSISCLLRAILDDNSTNVLLHQILAANTQFNWDLLSFGVTVVIGLS